MTRPLVLVLVSDLFFNVQIENALRPLGYEVRLIERGEAAGAHAPPQPTEPLSGPSARFVAQVVEWQPALILVELSSTSIPWPHWIAALKSSAATRRIPVLAFGPHVDLALRTQALNVGCDEVVAKSRLVTALPELVAKLARQVDTTALAAECAGALHPLAVEGIALFNAGEYFEAHEVLEHAWNATPGPARELYRGILQVAVAYLQITRRNYNGALKMFLRMRQWLDPLPTECQGVNVAQLRADALATRAELERLGAERIAEFDLARLQPVVVNSSPD